MDFSLSDAQIALRDSFRDYLDSAHPAGVLRRLAETGGRDTQVRQGLLDIGLPALLVPESAGGMGLGLVEATLIALELGRANVSDIQIETALIAAPRMARRGNAELLPDIAMGTLQVALSHPINPWIADLDEADFVLTAHGAMPKPAVRSRLESADPMRRLFAPLDCADEDDFLLNLAAQMTAAQLLGAAERMIDLATAYAKLRHQFGQPIGAFQAVKHLLATAAVRIAFAKPVLLRAAYALDQEMPFAATHVSHAKIAAIDAALLAGETAIQVHGAMGYTYEVDLHFWMKRAWALAGAWGDRNFHQRRLDHAIIGGTIPLGPGETFISEDHHA